MESECLWAEQAIAELTLAINSQLSEQVKRLVETKHLYQRLSVDAVDLVSKMRTRVYGDDEGKFSRMATVLLEFTPISPGSTQMFAVEKSGYSSPSLQLLLRNVKLSCSTCADRETFAPIWWTEVMNQLRKPVIRETPNYQPERATDQRFVLVYQCQNCMSSPTTFIIRRDAWKFILEGRSPMEHLAVPLCIPRTDRELYGEALVAAGAGKYLAALFFLRAAIEQFARRETNRYERTTGDELMAAYAETLPAEHRERMPSLGTAYEHLSEALHAARNDEALFERARSDIEQHFEIRRVYRIPQRVEPQP